MRTIVLTLSLILPVISLPGYAQDTIFFKNNSVVSAKITEVEIAEIKYKRFDNPEGPDYSVFKTEIAVIRYANGLTDSIKSTVSAPNTLLLARHEELKYTRNRVMYKGKRISDHGLKSLINAYEVPAVQTRLKREFKTLTYYKLNRQALAPGLFLSGAVIHLYGLNRIFGERGDGLETKAGNDLVAVFIVGAVLRISAHVINIVYKNKAMSKREEIVDIYNQ